MKAIKRAWEAYRPEIIWGIIALAVIHAPLIFSKEYRGPNLDAEQAGQFGDFVGGYIGTLILAASVIFLSASYRNQKRANEEMLREEIATNRRDAFESRFFELLKYQRENVAEFELGPRKGREVFISLIREFRAVWSVVNQSCVVIAPTYAIRERIDLAYLALYYGVEENSSRMLKKVTSNHSAPLVDQVHKDLIAAKQRYRVLTIESGKITDLTSRLRAEMLEERSQIADVAYTPFDGHQSRLAHYYRHFFQLVKYSHHHAPEGNAQEYISIARSQLTNYEQALFCLNALSKLGREWIAPEDFVTMYSLIRNIPEDFFDPQTELNLAALFPDISFEFMKENKLHGTQVSNSEGAGTV